jgi:hypothetical protein
MAVHIPAWAGHYIEAARLAAKRPSSGAMAAPGNREAPSGGAGNLRLVGVAATGLLRCVITGMMFRGCLRHHGNYDNGESKCESCFHRNDPLLKLQRENVRGLFGFTERCDRLRVLSCIAQAD